MNDNEFKEKLANIGKFLVNIGMNEKQIQDTIQKKKFADRLKFVLTEGKIEKLETSVGYHEYLSRTIYLLDCREVAGCL